MSWRERWARRSARERRLIVAAGVILVLLLARQTILVPFLAYRENLRDEIEAHRAWLENASLYVTRAEEVTRQRDLLEQRLKQVHAQLVPGDTPDLAAASLQNTLHGLADETGIEIRSTQVMRNEAVDGFRRVSVRVTVAGELRALADFLARLEYNPQRVSITFFEASKRGAVLRGQNARALSATIEVSAFLQGPEERAPAEAGDTEAGEGKAA
jgi:general secretion pathway protein M